MPFNLSATLLKHTAADFRAGLSAAVIGLPQEVNYGLLAVAPLGVAFAGQGIAAAFYASALAVIVSVLLGSGLGRISGTRPTLCILLAGLFASLQQLPGFTLASAWTYSAITILLAGLFLVIAARFGLGRFIKYVPAPVLIGFNNGIAVMLLISALPLALGASLGEGSLVDWLTHIQPAALLITFLTFWISVHPLRVSLFRYFPGILQALVFAWSSYQLLVHGMGVSAGPILGDLVLSLPKPVELATLFYKPFISVAMLAASVKFSLAIAVTAALETLATSATIDARLNQRTSGNGELRRLGITMICLSPLGMPVASSLGRSTALLAAAPFSRASHWYYAICMLSLGILGYELIARLPQAAIGGILLVVARNMIGHGLGQSLPKIRIAGELTERDHNAADFLVMLLVVLITVVDSFQAALAVGIISAMTLFIRDQSRSVVRRVQFGNHCHSLKLRSPKARAIQNQYGQEIAVIEAEGTIFFGSAESLGEKIESLSNGAKEIIIDLRRVNDIDGTACLLLEQTARRMNAKGSQLILSNLTPEHKLYPLLISRGMGGSIPVNNWFADLDSALEHAENLLLARHRIQEDATKALALAYSDLAAGLTVEQLGLLESYLSQRKLSSGELVFREGEVGNSMFVLTRGAVSIHVPQGNGYGKRLIAIGPGALLGEMAFISGAPRSADALADEETELLELDRKHFQELEDNHPAIAIAVLRAVSRTLSSRLNDRTNQVRELSEA